MAIKRRSVGITLGLVAVVSFALYAGWRGHYLSDQAQRAETWPVPPGLLKGQTPATQTKITQAFRYCLGQAVLDDVPVSRAAPGCARRLSLVVP